MNPCVDFIKKKRQREGEDLGGALLTAVRGNGGRVMGSEFTCCSRTQSVYLPLETLQHHTMSFLVPATALPTDRGDLDENFPKGSVDGTVW